MEILLTIIISGISSMIGGVTSTFLFKIWDKRLNYLSKITFIVMI